MTRPDGRPWPTTAEALMRSRFEAFRDNDPVWLLASWHPSTRPATLTLADNPSWRGLQVLDTVAGGTDDDTGIVEFRATFLAPGGGVDVQRERSRFVREDGRWYYLAGLPEIRDVEPPRPGG
ncbi:MAG: YchJ family metal-binding protein [Propionicimonas sp.]|nr:YchJ family metal-binding protein [Propionicimonas sp.]